MENRRAVIVVGKKSKLEIDMSLQFVAGQLEDATLVPKNTMLSKRGGIDRSKIKKNRGDFEGVFES